MKFKFIIITFLLVSSALLSACSVGPDYERPPVATPQSYKESGIWKLADPKDDFDHGVWWEIYKDPILNNLEQQIDVSNQNLIAAEATYRQAQALIDETTASLFPSIGINSTSTRSALPSIRPKNTFSASSNASWTADIWGSIRRSIENDEANAEASAANIGSARLSAQGSLATAYFNLRVQDELKRILQTTVDADQKILNIVKNQYEAGVASKADLLSAESQMETAKSSLINSDINRLRYEHAIAVLIGKPPADFILTATRLNYRIPQIPSSVPSTLLERRPDIAMAERQMAAANAQIGVQIAAWYPNLTLNASYGYSALMFSKLIQASNSLWSVGPTVAETIFDGGARDARITEARASYDQSIANYRQTVLAAFQEVEDNLGSLRVLEQQEVAATAALVASIKSETITLNQYKEGIVSFNDVLIAETTRLNSEQSALTVYQGRLLDSVALIQSLGGGWTTEKLTDPLPHPHSAR